MRASSREIEVWMQEHLATDADERCVEWPFAKSPRGYGMYKQGYAHRFVLTHFQGPPTGERTQCAHKCGNPSCVNPNHLRWATPKENTQDKKLHGTWPEGENAGRAVLTRDSVVAIFLDDRPHPVIAEQYGVTAANVSSIKRRKSWAKYTDDLSVDHDAVRRDRRQRESRARKDADFNKWHTERLLYETIYPDSDRNACIMHLREKGATLQVIGDLYFITKERVRQILT